MTAATLFGVLAAFLMLAPGAFAQDSGVIGIKLGYPTSYSSGATYLFPTDTAGAVPVDNWNDFIANTSWPATQGTNNLTDSTGTYDGAILTLTGVKNAWYDGNTGYNVTSGSTPNARLLADTLIIKNGNTDTYTISSLPAVGNYDVYVYLSGQDNNDQVIVTCPNAGVTYYQEELGTPVTNNQVLFLGNNTTSGTYPICNYVEFSGVTPTANAISFSLTQPGTAQNGGVAGVELVPSSSTFFAVAQPQSVYITYGQNATFNSGAIESPTVANTFQWYQISGGTTNAVGGNSASYTAVSPSANAGYYVTVNNGSITLTSSVALLNVAVSGTWATGSGSWNTPGDWVSSQTANGVGSTASFVNGDGGTVTLDNAAGWTVGTEIFGITLQTSPQTPWIIAPGSPAGTLTMALNPNVPSTVASGSAAPTVVNVPVITVYSNNPVTITAPLAGNQGLFVNGGGTLVLAGNNTFTGPTVVGANNSDVTSLQIGNGGTSGAIDFTQPILYLSGYGHLIFNRSDTITLQSALNDQAGKCPNLIVNSGTVIWAPTLESNPYDGAIVNSGGTLVLDCPAAIWAIANNSGTVQITNGLPASSTDGDGNGGNAQNVSLGISSGGTVRLAGPGGNGVNIKNDNEGVLDNGVFDLAGDAIQVGFLAGSGIVTNSSSTNDILTLSGIIPNAAYPWNGTIADGASATTAVTTSAGTTVFNGANTYTGPTIISGTLMLSNSASLASASINVNGANLILAGTPTLTNPHATISVGSGRALNLTALSGNFTVNSGQTLTVTNTGAVNAGANPITVVAAANSILNPGGSGVAGTMNVNANLTLNGNTNLFDLASTATEGGGVNDEIVGVTNLTLTGNIKIVVNTAFNNTFSASTTYKLIKYSGTLANTATFTVSPATLGGNPVTIDTVSQPGYVLLTTGGNAAPGLAALATNIDAFTGYPVTLSVAESGTTPITNQWAMNGTAIGGQTTTSYTFTPVTPGVYAYTLNATNAVGHASVTFNVTVGSPTISIQCALATSYCSSALYLAPSNTAGEYAVSNWNVIITTPQNNVTDLGISSTTLVDTNGFVTPATFTAYNVQDGWYAQNNPVATTSASSPNAQMMNTYWYANPIAYHSQPPTNTIVFTITNLPNDTYNVYVYLLQSVSSGTGGPVEVYDSTSLTNYLEYSEYFTSQSNFVTAFDYTGSLPYPYGNYAHLVISTGGSNSLSFTESGTVAGVGGAGVCGVQITPEVPVAPAITEQPVSERVVTNTTGTFSVQASGYPLYYQWYVISPAGVTNSIGGATGSSYTTAPVVDANTGTGYFVIVSNVLSQVQSATAYLTVGHMVTASLVIDNQFFDDGVPGIGTIFNTIPGLFPNSMLLSSPNTWLTTYPPVNVKYLTAFQSPVNDLAIEAPPQQPEAEQLYGWFTPAVSGDYVFFMTTDDEGTLWLSTDSSPTNSYQIAQNEAGMVDLDWLCANTGSPEYTSGDYTSAEFRSDQFIGNSGNQSPYSEYTCTSGWVPTPNFNATDGGIALVAGTRYYIELDNAYGGGAGDNQSAAVTCKLAGQPDPTAGSASLLTGNKISASVPDSALPAPTPVITSIALNASGTKAILQANNGLLNARCYVLSSTNLTQPWTTAAAGIFNLSGSISVTNLVVPSTQATFYQLKMYP
jgi:autotransporter-associated beta strand protein